MRNMEVIPAILSDNASQVDEWLQKIKDSNKFGRVQIDFIDGEFSNNFTITPEQVEPARYFPLETDAHLMVVEKNIDKWKHMAQQAGFTQIIAQAESISNPENFTGLALDIHSPVEEIENYLFHLNKVIVMAVEPGFGGQKFDPEVMEKIEKLSRIRKTKNFKYSICVDGGVTQEHLEELEKAGADEVAVGVKRVLEWK
jgi:ribulose-phosphate 3-epimerase